MATKTGQEPSESELRAQVDQLRADLDKLADQLVQSGSGQVARFAEELRNAGERALHSAGRTVEAGRAKGDEQIVAAQSWIREHPLTAVACALGVGFLLAQLRDRR